MQGLIGSLVGPGVRGRQNNIDFSQALRDFFTSQRSKSGPAVTIDTALGVTTVLACTRALAEGNAQLPIKIMLEDDQEQKTVARDHAVHKVLSRRPNEWMNSFSFRETMMYHAVLTGNAFAFKNIVRGNLRELIPIPPGYVTIRRQPDYSLVYEITDATKGTIGTFTRAQIFHLTGPSWNNYSGLEIIRLAREAIGLSIATEENHAFLHANGSQVSGLLSTDQAVDEKGILRIKALWAQSREGRENKGGTAVLDKNFKYTPMGMSGVDTEHLATREHQIQEICRAMGVFPMIIGFADKTATFASAESFFTAHVVLSLSPWVQRWQDAVNTQLLTEKEFDGGYFCKLFTAGLLRGDARARAAFYQVMVLTGIFTRNECRSLEDMNKLEGLDEPLVPLNMGAAGTEQGGPNAPDAQPANTLPNIAIAPKGLVDAMRVALMGHNRGPRLDDEARRDARQNAGRVLSAANETLIRDATDLIGQADGKLITVLDKLKTAPEVPDDGS
jgi:HK97 family phage portal protein